MQHPVVLAADLAGGLRAGWEAAEGLEAGATSWGEGTFGMLLLAPFVGGFIGEHLVPSGYCQALSCSICR